MKPNKPLRDMFSYFRQAWSPRAAYHLARLRQGEDWRDRLASAVWLIRESVPRTGAAPSTGFRGLP